MQVDARYTEARKTDQSGGRGWDLFPDADSKKSTEWGWIIVGIAFVAILAVGVMR